MRVSKFYFASIFVVCFTATFIAAKPNIHPYPNEQKCDIAKELEEPCLPTDYISKCSGECRSGDCDVPTINAKCYGKYSDIKTTIKTPTRKRRNAINTNDWPKSKDGLIYIPYTFNDLVTEERLEHLLRKAEEEYEKHTCYRLKRRTNELNYVNIVDYQGCWSLIGMQMGRQYLSLSPECEELDIVLHEFMHTIGFYHEMQRRDRDKHIRLNWANILPSFYSQFEMNKYGEGFTHGKEYDINSILHYKNRVAAKDKDVDTMTSIRYPEAKLGVEPDSTFSEGDKRMLVLKGLCGIDIKVHSGPYAKSNNVL